jgi:hypothetical protein
MAAEGRGGLWHLGKLVLVFVAVGAAYSLALIGVNKMGPTGPVWTWVPPAVSWQACLKVGWRNFLYQPLFWLTTGLVFIVYNLVTREIDPL